jgi:phenylalanyl-tRNA synthetase beta chain
MRVPLSWLRQYVDFDLAPEELADRLTALGFELQGVERVGTDWSSVVVGELLEVTPHPNAQSLSLTKVRVGEGQEPLSIVCGATNIAVGQRVPVALPGAVLPGGRNIGVSRIQGEESQGMLCSGDELGLTPDAEGILILSDGRLGRPLEDVVGDVVLDLDVKPNRGDALSLIGLAREVAAIGAGRVRWPDIQVPESGDATSVHVSVEVEDEALCPRFVGRYVDGVSVAASPLEVQLRLTAAGVRPVSNVVDASNYVMIEMGKPIHNYDAARVAEGRIIVRVAREGEHLETLDHVDRPLTSDTLLIADPRGPLGIAGVMGGAESEVGPATTAVIIESAVFDPLSIRRTAQRYALRSEASARFEKGQESRLALLGADRTAQLLAEWAGGRPALGAVDTNPVPDVPRRVSFRPSRVSRLLGAQIPATEMQQLLARVDIATEPAETNDRLVIVEGDAPPPLSQPEASEMLVAVVPAHRRDIAIEADISEEVCRLRGYEELPSVLPDTAMPGYRADPTRFTDSLREMLAGRGLAEVVTNALIAPQDHARLGIAAGDRATVSVANPVAADHSELRRSLAPGLVRVLVANERQRREDVAVYEIGSVYGFVEGEASQADRLGLLLSGSWQVQSWAQPARPAAVEDAKGIIEAIAERLGIAGLHYGEVQPLALVEHPGRTAGVFAGAPESLDIGRVGELDPRYLAAYDARSERVIFGWLDLAALRRLSREVPLVGQLARLPAAERDLAVVVGRDLPQLRVEAVIRQEAGPLLDRLSLFDRYQGPPLEPSEISLAYRLRFQPMERPLAEGELEGIMERIAGSLADRLDARLRGGEGTPSS